MPSKATKTVKRAMKTRKAVRATPLIMHAKISQLAYARLSGNKGIAKAHGIRLKYSLASSDRWMITGTEKHVKLAHVVATAIDQGAL